MKLIEAFCTFILRLCPPFVHTAAAAYIGTISGWLARSDHREDIAWLFAVDGARHLGVDINASTVGTLRAGINFGFRMRDRFNKRSLHNEEQKWTQRH